MKRLVTKRLILRTFLPTDWQDLYEYMSISDVVKYEPYPAFNKQACLREAVKRANDPNHAFWAVCLQNSNKMIGHVYFEQTPPLRLRTWEIGYVFNPVYYHHGYATEACQRILKYGFTEQQAHRITAGTHVNNQASWKLLQRLAMRRESHCLQNIYFHVLPSGDPLWHDTYRYAILANEFFEQNNR